MYNYEKEVDQIRKMYNFGDANEQEASSSHSRPLSEDPSRLVDVELHSDNEEDERARPSGNQKNSFDASITPQSHMEASAFESEFSRSTGVNASQTTLTPSTSALQRKEKPKGNSKLNIAKEVLGLNKKNTSKMTPSEKERVLLEERWKKAIAEENRLNALEEQIKTREEMTASAGLIPNFPPTFLCIKPLVHHDFAIVPEVRRKFVKLNFINWIATCALLVINMIVAVAVVFAPYRTGAEKKFNKGQNTALAIVYLIGAPLSFIVWYWHVYGACSTGRHTKHLLSLGGLMVALGFSVFMIVGRSNYGACGVDLIIDISETKAKLVMLPVIVVLFLWVAEAAFLCYCIVRQWMYYRLDVTAQEEAKRHMRNVIGV